MSDPGDMRVYTMQIERKGGKWGWSCECGLSGGDWDYWETVELVVNSHRRHKHGGTGRVLGYDLREGVR